MNDRSLPRPTSLLQVCPAPSAALGRLCGQLVTVYLTESQSLPIYYFEVVLLTMKVEHNIATFLLLSLPKNYH